MQMLLLSMLHKWPSEAYDLDDKRKKMNCTFKDNSKATVYGLLRKLKKRGLISHQVKSISDGVVDVYKLTDEGHRALKKGIDRSPAFAKWFESASLALGQINQRL
jgi:DNA-binding PadR family transcriptional regulator